MIGAIREHLNPDAKRNHYYDITRVGDRKTIQGYSDTCIYMRKKKKRRNMHVTIKESTDLMKIIYYVGE